MVDDLAAFAQAFPKVELTVNFSDHQLDVIREGIDLAIRVGTVQDSSLKSKKLANLERKMVASSDYCSKFPKPENPSDLSVWHFIGLKMRPNDKLLMSKSGKTVRIHYEPQVVSDNIHAVVQMAKAGLGIVSPPNFLVEKDINNGRIGRAVA